MTEPPDTLSRRELARRSGRVAALAALPAAVAGGLLAPATAAAQTPGDTLLIPAIGLEETLASVYGRARRSGKLNRGQRRLVVLLGEQSRAHARILREQLSDDSFAPPTGGDVRGLGPGAAAKEYLTTALGFENQVYLNYLDAIGSLSPGAASLAVTGIAASTAQHLALLREALGRTPIPAPAETGANA